MARSIEQETSASLFARSAFALALFPALAMLISVPFLMIPQSSVSLTFLVKRAVFIPALAVELLLCRRLLRSEFPQLLPVSEKITRVLSRPWLAALLGLLLVEAVLFLLQFIKFLAPDFPRLALFIAFTHILSAFVGLLIVNWRGLSGWIEATRAVWTGVSVALLILIVINVLVYANAQIADPVEILFRGRPTAASFNPVSDRKLNAVEFWTEYHEVFSGAPERARWLPYTYARTAPFSGKYHNVGSEGLRRTASFAGNTGRDVRRVFVFGGSTVWGFGARDEYTIPSCLALLFHEKNQNVEVTNFGEGGYTSTQDLILFMRQLQLGNIPDVAVFYQGLNEVYGVYSSGYAGVPSQEYNRIREFNLGRMLFYRAMKNRDSLIPVPPVNLVPHVPFKVQTIEEIAPGLDISLMSRGGSAKDIVDIYLENVRVIQMLSKEYKVRPLFVWQPTPWIAKPLVSHEALKLKSQEATRAGTRQLFEDTDSELHLRLRERPVENFLDLSRLFEDEPKLIYIDAGHATEEGNLIMARGILSAVETLLAETRNR